jgi:hypothetical protein
MRKAILIAGLASPFCVAFADQTNPEYRGLMKSMPPALMAIRDAADNATAAEVLPRWPRLSTTYRLLEGQETVDAIASLKPRAMPPERSPPAPAAAPPTRENPGPMRGGCHEAHRGTAIRPRRTRRQASSGWSVRPIEDSRPDQRHSPVTYHLRWAQPDFLSQRLTNPAITSSQRD